MSKRILLVSGSDRIGSFNEQLVEIVAEKLREKGLEADVLDYSDVPLLSQNTEYPTPIAVQNLREKVGRADALFVVSPEYNGSYTARLKNLFDWLSRPVVQGDNTTPTVIGSKKVGFGSVANSTYGKFVRGNLATYFNYIRMDVMPGEGLGLRIPGAAWGTGILTTELETEQVEAIDNYVNEFVKFVG